MVLHIFKRRENHNAIAISKYVKLTNAPIESRISCKDGSWSFDGRTSIDVPSKFLALPAALFRTGQVSEPNFGRGLVYMHRLFCYLISHVLVDYTRKDEWTAAPTTLSLPIGGLRQWTVHERSSIAPTRTLHDYLAAEALGVSSVMSSLRPAKLFFGPDDL